LPGGAAMQGTREGIWWLPTSQTRDYLLITNMSGHLVQTSVTLTDASGSASWSQPLSLPAHGTTRLSVRNLGQQAGLKGMYGGIQEESALDGGAIDAVYLLFDEASGFSATMKMFAGGSNPAPLAHRDFDHSGKWKPRAPMLALSQPDPALAFPAGTTLQPALL